MSTTDHQTLFLGIQPSLCLLGSGESDGSLHPCLDDPFCSGVLSSRRAGSLALEGEKGGLQAQQGERLGRLAHSSEAIEAPFSL